MANTAFVFLAFCWFSASNAACPYDDVSLEPWDDPDTWGGNVPKQNDRVTIPTGKKVLFNTSPPPLGSITIEKDAALIWGNIPDLNLTVSYIHVKGNFEIGSQDCRFTHKAHILLTGKSNSDLKVHCFGRKFLGVDANGTLEFHGEDKLSWTKLIQTVPAAVDTCAGIYNHREHVYASEITEGLHAIAFKTDGTLYDFQTFRTNHDGSDPADAFETFVKDIPDGFVIAVALNVELGTVSYPDRNWEKIYSAIETAGGLTTGSSELRNIGYFDAYAFITQKGQSNSTKEQSAAQKTSEGQAETERLSIGLSNLKFSVKCIVVNKTSQRNDVDFRVITAGVANPIIKLNADVMSWKIGDKIVVTSTDYDWRQAEVFTIIKCENCAANEIQLDHEFENMHFGEITYGIDERAEVAMLSRNILIEGQLEDECYSYSPEEDALCSIYHADTFGGHFKVLRGFKNVHVEQCEFFHMGQQLVIGSYSIHFHMCDDADGAWIRDNTIHDAQARCLTIHGTDGLEVSGNVCYKHYGHGFFLEDSVEQRNILDGNIGIGTMHGTQIMTDKKKQWCGELRGACDALATFWLTHPNNYIRNNVAAGSDTAGFWFITADEPLGPSYKRQYEERHLVMKYSARFTKIAQFENNVAHSNEQRGLRIDSRISNGEYDEDLFIPENGLLQLTWPLDPKEPPIKKGKAVINYMNGFTAYKNRIQDIWAKTGKLVMQHFSLADSPRGISIARATKFVWTEITDSLFVGETNNTGKPSWPYERSLPKGKPDEPLIGIATYQGPGFVTNCHFDRYFHRYWNGVFRPAGAISFKQHNAYQIDPNSYVKGITYGFCDKTEGLWVYNGDKSSDYWEDLDGNQQANIKDIDGSVTGTPNTQIVKHDRYFTTPRCSVRPEWNMDVCPYEYARLKLDGAGGVLERPFVKNYAMLWRRDDQPEDGFSMLGQKNLNYLVIVGKSYTAYFKGEAPREISIQGENFHSGLSVRFALCLPKDTERFEFPENTMTEVFSVADVDNDETGSSYFWDKDRGLLVLKMTSNVERVDGERCPGYKCPVVTVVRVGGGNDEIDCYEDAYKDGTYNQTEDAPTGIPEEKSCVKSKADGRGAPVVESIFPSSEYSTTCPASPSYLDRSASEYQGCFIDVPKYRDLDEKLQSLLRSMTVDSCVERCYQLGFAYAALQKGKECRCGNSYGAHGEDAEGCTKPCSGNSEQMCGDTNRNSIYSTGNPLTGSHETCGPDNSGAVINKKCYYLGEEEVSFQEGQRACVKHGGDLATIATAEVQEEVVKYLRPKKSSAWFGLRDDFTEGVYEFMDGTSLGSYSNFRSGEEVESQDFGLLLADAVYQWSDRVATEKHKYLCQLPIDGSKVSVESCGTNSLGKRIGNGGCYAVVNDKNNYDNAEYACYTRMGTLASLTDGDTKEEIISHLYHFGVESVDYWTGEKGTDENMFKELTYKSLYRESSVPKTAQNGAICLLETLDVSKKCSTAWELHGDFCYLYTGRGSSSMATSLSICKQGASNLLTIHSEDENTFVGNLVRNFNPSSKPKVRLGYQYNNDVGSFQWTDGESSSYENWDSGHGVGKIGVGTCARLNTRSTNFYWQNSNCNKDTIKFICKARAGS